MHLKYKSIFTANGTGCAVHFYAFTINLFTIGVFFNFYSELFSIDSSIFGSLFYVFVRLKLRITIFTLYIDSLFYQFNEMCFLVFYCVKILFRSKGDKLNTALDSSKMVLIFSLDTILFIPLRLVYCYDMTLDSCI